MEKLAEIVGVPHSTNNDYVKTIVSIASVGINNLSVSKVFRVHTKDVSAQKKKKKQWLK